MKRIRAIPLITVLILLLLHNTVPAFGFRCGVQLVSIGDSKFEVVAACGEPDNIEIWEVERFFRDYSGHRYRGWEGKRHRQPLGGKVYVTIEEWTYNLGPTKFIRFLRFENGRLRKIFTGDKGY